MTNISVEWSGRATSLDQGLPLSALSSIVANGDQVILTTTRPNHPLPRAGLAPAGMSKTESCTYRNLLLTLRCSRRFAFCVRFVSGDSAPSSPGSNRIFPRVFWARLAGWTTRKNESFNTHNRQLFSENAIMQD